jgi:NAD(P)-dependent dehydrogenase (short-subunit alcohol dehydrogenase family)
MSPSRSDAPVVIVTGAASGIGEAVTRTLARRGWAVGLFDVDAKGEVIAEEIVAEGSKAEFAQVDVSSETEVEVGVAHIDRVLGPVAALVNNAGIIFDSADAVSQTWKQWVRIMHVNAGGAFLCTRTVLPSMLARGGGVIVNVASISGLVGIRGQSAYCMSKGAIIQLTRQVTAEFARQGIRCAAVCPGSIETPLLTRAAEQDHGLLEVLRAGHPVGRLGAPSEIAAVVDFLLSPDASFMHGSIIAVDGGYTAV